MPVNNWRSHVKYRIADLIQRVALFVAKIYIYNMCQLVEREEPLMIKTSLCQVQSSCWQIVVISATYRKKERVVNIISTSCISQVCVFSGRTMVSAINNKVRIVSIKISIREKQSRKSVKIFIWQIIIF